MAQWLRVVGAYPEDPDSISSFHRVTSWVTPALGNLAPSSHPLRTLHTDTQGGKAPKHIQ